MKTIRYILGIIVFSLSGYMLLTNEYGILPYTLFLLGLMVLIQGISEIQEKRKVIGIISMLSAGFGLFIGLYILLS
ncbi:Protein of unknown function [Psychrobacillus sp. OK028]|uniref:YczI family protein n=1 Tax=Psychrobacillus sp. OK028 TaxID=1884359 RepID=UPI00088E71DC|nr:YczI family protein [Psychrobacillus sp. OK028]SDM89763.1 Protein of unknown function [Psychrobacillus sp. OK028]